MGEAPRDDGPLPESGGSWTFARYFDVSVKGDQVERLLTEVFAAHWTDIAAGPLIEGAAFEIRFTALPKVTMAMNALTAQGMTPLSSSIMNSGCCMRQQRCSFEASAVRKSTASLSIWTSVMDLLVTKKTDLPAAVSPDDPVPRGRAVAQHRVHSVKNASSSALFR